MHLWMMNCQEISKKVSESFDRPLPIWQRLGIRMHLLMCKYCARFRQQLILLHKALGAIDAQAEESELLSTDAKERIRNAIRNLAKEA